LQHVDRLWAFFVEPNDSEVRADNPAIGVANAQ
jgi:hypothetical protein